MLAEETLEQHQVFLQRELLEQTRELGSRILAVSNTGVSLERCREQDQRTGAVAEVCRESMGGRRGTEKVPRPCRCRYRPQVLSLSLRHAQAHVPAQRQFIVLKCGQRYKRTPPAVAILCQGNIQGSRPVAG